MGMVYYSNKNHQSHCWLWLIAPSIMHSLLLLIGCNISTGALFSQQYCVWHSHDSLQDGFAYLRLSVEWNSFQGCFTLALQKKESPSSSLWNSAGINTSVWTQVIWAVAGWAATHSAQQVRETLFPLKNHLVSSLSNPHSHDSKWSSVGENTKVTIPTNG